MHTRPESSAVVTPEPPEPHDDGDPCGATTPTAGPAPARGDEDARPSTDTDGADTGAGTDTRADTDPGTGTAGGDVDVSQADEAVGRTDGAEADADEDAADRSATGGAGPADGAAEPDAVAHPADGPESPAAEPAAGPARAAAATAPDAVEEPASSPGGPTPPEAPSAAEPEPATEPPAASRWRRFVRAARAAAPRTAVAVVGGLGLAAAFPPYDLWPLSVLSVAVLSVLVRGRTVKQAAWLGFAFGLPFFCGLLVWLHVVGVDAIIGLSAIESVFLVLMAIGLAVTWRLPGAPLWGACLWVTQEWARDRVPFGGFPWGRLAFANTDSPYTPLAAVGGAPLVTFAVALSGTLLAAAAVRLWRDRGRFSLVAAVATAGAGAVLASGFAVPVPTGAEDEVTVAIVQGDVQKPGMDFLGRPMLILNNHVRATLQLAEDVKSGRKPKPDLVIWPENASDLDPYRNPEARARIEQAVAAVGVPVLVGALVDGPDETHVQNQGIVWDPKTGPGDSYTKQHPVPFGEYVPFRAQLTKVISRLERVPRDFWHGSESGVLQVGPARLGDVICFEIAYDEIVRDTVNGGARALVVQTNNATYGNTAQPEQQLAMSKLRAVEHGRAVITAATSGITAVVRPDGTVEQQAEEFVQEVLVTELPLRDGRTVADRVGAAPEWTISIVGLLAWLAVGIGSRRSRNGQKGQA